MLPKQAINEFQQIYFRKVSGELLSNEEIQEKAENFIRLMTLITNNEKEIDD